MEINYVNDLINKNIEEMTKFQEKRIKEVLDNFFKVDLDTKDATEMLQFITTKRQQGYEILINDGGFTPPDKPRNVYIEIRHNKDVIHKELLMQVHIKINWSDK